MPEDLPIYPDSILRTRLQFADLDRLKSVDVSPSWEKFDHAVAGMEGASNVAEARSALTEPSKPHLVQLHLILFRDQAGVGQFRRASSRPVYRGQDCPDPPHIDRALTNFFNWLSADSFREIHPVEKTALVLTRLIDIWPFEFGNKTTALVFSNFFTRQAGYAPFYLAEEEAAEFDKILEMAISAQTQPLVSAIHNAIRREMKSLVGK